MATKGGNEPVAGARLEIGASEKNLEKGLDAAASTVERFTKDSQRAFGQMSARIQGYVDKLDARAATERLQVLEQAVARLGGASNLTAPQLVRVQAEIQKLADQGGRVPPALQAINKETDKLTAAAKAAASGQGWSGILGAISPPAAAAAAGVAALTAGVAVAVRAIGQAIVQTATYAGGIKNLSDSYNINVVSLQRLKAAAEDADVPTETLLAAVKNIAKALSETPQKFEALGLSVEKLLAMNPDEQLFAVAEAIRAIENPTLQSAAAMDLLGKTGPEMLRLLKTNMREVADEAERMGRIMDEDLVRQSAELKSELDKLDKTWEGFKTNAASVVTSNKGTAESVKLLTETFGTLSLVIQKSKGLLAEGWPEAGFLNELVARMAKATKEAANEAARLSAAYPGATPKEIQDMLAASEEGRRKLEEDAEKSAKKQREIAARNRDLDGKASAEAMERERKRTEELSNQVLAIKVRELAIKKGITEAAARAEIEARLKTIEWLTERAKNDAAVVAKAEAVKADAKRLGMKAIDAQIDKIEEATAAALRHVDALELEGKIGVEAADAARDAYEDAADAEIRYAKQLETLNKINKVRDLFGELTGLFDELGISADSNLGKAARAGEQLAGAVGSGASAFFAFQSGDYLTAVKEGLKSVTQLVGGIKTLFSEPSWKKVGREAGRILGMEVSEELAKQIEKTAKDLKIDVASASLLNLSKAIETSRRDAREFTGQVGQLMAGIADGSIPAKEGVKELGTVFNQVREAAADAGTVGDAALTSILQAARQLGGAAYTEEMKAFTGEKLDASAGFLKQWIEAFSKLKGLGQETMGRLGAQGAEMFMANFQAVAAERGKLAAVSLFGDDFEALKKKLEEGGNKAALALLEPFQRWQSYVSDETLGPLLQMMEAGRGQLVNLADAGYLNVDTFRSMQQSSAELFDSMLAKGMAMPDALEAVVPSIRAAIAAAEQFGVPLDENTERLRRQAEEQGYTFAPGPMQQQLELLRIIAVQLGAVLPKELQKSAAATESFGKTATGAFEDTAAGAEEMSEAVAGSWDAGAGVIEQRALEMREGVAGEVTALADSAVLATQEMGFEVADEIAAMADEGESEVAELTKAFDREVAKWGGIARDATNEVNQALDSLPDVLDITIRLSGPTPGAFGFNFDGSPDNDGDKSNSFKYGGIEDFGTESNIAVHGREAIVPEGGRWFMDMLRRATREGIAMAAQGPDGRGEPRTIVLEIDGREVTRVVIERFEGNEGGAGKRAATALARY